MSNQEDVANLIEDLSQRDFIVFAGAGVPEITRVPTWKDLLSALAKQLEITGVDIKNIDPYLYPEVAQMLYVMFERENRTEEYYRIIREEIEPKAASQTNLQQEIVLAAGRIITTNYDDTFERAFKTLHERGTIKSDCEFQTVANLNNEGVDKKNFITYLHGRFDETSIIFKTIDYEKNYTCLNEGSESHLEKLLRYVYCKTREALVFVGFSFGDRYITRTVERISEQISREHIERKEDPDFTPFLQKIQHYALLEDLPDDGIDLSEQVGRSDLDSEQYIKIEKLRGAKLLEEKLESMKVKVIRYEYNKHVQLEDWFKGIRQRRNAQRKASIR